MFSNSPVIRMMRCVVAMQSLSSCAWSNSENDGVMNLRKTNALVDFFVADLNKMSALLVQQVELVSTHPVALRTASKKNVGDGHPQ